MKKNNKKGFTLAELLIVVAIIAILAAIAIPIFNMQLEKSRVAVDTSNMRAAKSMAIADALQNADHYGPTADCYYVFNEDAQGNLIMADRGTSASDGICAAGDPNAYKEGTLVAKSKDHPGAHIYIKIRDAKIIDAKWL